MERLLAQSSWSASWLSRHGAPPGSVVMERLLAQSSWSASWLSRHGAWTVARSLSLQGAPSPADSPSGRLKWVVAVTSSMVALAGGCAIRQAARNSTPSSDPRVMLVPPVPPRFVGPLRTAEVPEDCRRSTGQQTVPQLGDQRARWLFDKRRDVNAVDGLQRTNGTLVELLTFPDPANPSQVISTIRTRFIDGRMYELRSSEPLSSIAGTNGGQLRAIQLSRSGAAALVAVTDSGSLERSSPLPADVTVAGWLTLATADGAYVRDLTNGPVGRLLFRADPADPWQVMAEGRPAILAGEVAPLISTRVDDATVVRDLGGAEIGRERLSGFAVPDWRGRPVAFVAVDPYGMQFVAFWNGGFRCARRIQTEVGVAQALRGGTGD